MSNSVPCGIPLPRQPDPETGDRCVYFRIRGRPFSVGRRDFSPWLTAEALDQFDPMGREALEFMLEVAEAEAVNNERAHRKSGRGGLV